MTRLKCLRCSFEWNKRDPNSGRVKKCRNCGSLLWDVPILPKTVLTKMLCPRCNRVLPIDEFYSRKSGKRAGQPMTPCKSCANKLRTDWSHENDEAIPMNESKESPVYLGVYVAERALSKFFNNIQRMPYGNVGYDFICGRGLKIDVKSSCLHKGGQWGFNIRKNHFADYFLCIAFDDRDNLNPLHVWLIPSDVINERRVIHINGSPRSLSRWAKYERPLDKVTACCQVMH